MTILKKLQTIVLVNALILTICFPPMTKQAEAATLHNSVYYVTVDELKGRSSVLELLGNVFLGLITDSEFNFFDTKLKGMVLQRLVETEHGQMVITIKPSDENELVDAGTLYINTRKLNFNVWRTIGDLPSLIRAGTVFEVTANIIELESSSMQIDDLIVETTFDQNEIARIQSLQNELDEETKIEENLEDMLLALDEAEGGPLSQQKEAYEALLNDLPILQGNLEQIEERMEEGSEQKLEIERQLTSLEELLQEAEQLIQQPEWDETLEQIKEELARVSTDIDNFIVTVEQLAQLIETIQEKVAQYVELLELRLEYLKELGLDGWSMIYEEFIEVHETLLEIKEKLEGYVERIHEFTNKIDEFHERLENITETLESLENAYQREHHQTNEQKDRVSMEQLDELLERLQDKEIEDFEIIHEDEHDEIEEEQTLEQLQQEFEQSLRQIEEQVEQWSEEEYIEREQEILRAIKEELAIYAKKFIQHADELNAQLNELDTKEEQTDEDQKLRMELEEKLASIEEIIARIEEVEYELSQLIE